jgi:hypothetical protein
MRHHHGDKWGSACMLDRAPSRWFNLPLSRLPGPYKGCPTMNSKLLWRKSYGVKQLREGLGGQQENIEGLSEPLEATRNRTTRSTWLLTPRPAS